MRAPTVPWGSVSPAFANHEQHRIARLDRRRDQLQRRVGPDRAEEDEAQRARAGAAPGTAPSISRFRARGGPLRRSPPDGLLRSRGPAGSSRPLRGAPHVAFEPLSSSSSPSPASRSPSAAAHRSQPHQRPTGNRTEPDQARPLAWLLHAQNAEGGWGTEAGCAGRRGHHQPLRTGAPPARSHPGEGRVPGGEPPGAGLRGPRRRAGSRPHPVHPGRGRPSRSASSAAASTPSSPPSSSVRWCAPCPPARNGDGRPPRSTPAWRRSRPCSATTAASPRTDGRRCSPAPSPPTASTPPATWEPRWRPRPSPAPRPT